MIDPIHCRSNHFGIASEVAHLAEAFLSFCLAFVNQFSTCFFDSPVCVINPLFSTAVGYGFSKWLYNQSFRAVLSTLGFGVHTLSDRLFLHHSEDFASRSFLAAICFFFASSSSATSGRE